MKRGLRDAAFREGSACSQESIKVECHPNGDEPRVHYPLSSNRTDERGRERERETVKKREKAAVD